MLLEVRFCTFVLRVVVLPVSLVASLLPTFFAVELKRPPGTGGGPQRSAIRQAPNCSSSKARKEGRDTKCSPRLDSLISIQVRLRREWCCAACTAKS